MKYRKKMHLPADTPQMPQTVINPRLANVTTVPAIMIPQSIAGRASFIGILNMNAATQPVQAPEGG